MNLFAEQVILHLLYIDQLAQPKKVQINEHFSPSWKICDVCHVPFNYIGKVETRSEDMRYLNRKLGLNFPDINIHKTVTASVAKRMNDTSQHVKEIHMPKLPDNKRKFICDFLMFDFLLFDYDSTWCDIETEKNTYLKNKR